MESKQPVIVLVSDEYLALNTPKSIRLQSVTPFADQETPVWEGALPLAVFLSSDEPVSDGFETFIAQLDIPLHRCSEKETQAEFTKFLLDVSLASAARSADSAAHERAVAAALRQDFMELQQGFIVTERFIYGAMAPEFSLSREWEPADATTDSPVLQPLPVGSTALAAVDVWLTAPGTVSFALKRPQGADLIEPKTVNATASGWCRLLLDAPLTGLAEDMVLSVSATAPLGLSYPCALPNFCVVDNHPLALRIWKGMPGVRLPNIPTNPGGAHCELVPPSHMPTPEVLGDGSVELLKNRDALSLHPGPDGRLHMVFRGLNWQGAALLAAYVQNHGPEIVQVSLGVATGADDPVFRPALHLSPSVYAQCDADLPDGSIDLHLKLTSDTPMAHVILWGFERRPTA